MNPFTFGNPIKEPERFYGRSAEIRQIINRLLSSAHESTSIVGERRIGKTSLLYHLSHPDVSARLGLTPDKFCLVYVDFQGLTDITPTRFWQRVLKKMAATICNEALKPAIEKLSQQNEFDLFDLEDLFQASQQKGLTIVLMMDEFEYITQNPNFKNDFYGGLRALAIHHGVALLPATRRELVDLCYSDEIKGSPFFNIFANVVLRPFSPLEVEELINGYLGKENISLLPEEKEIITDLGGGYPFFVQMAGHYLVEGKSQSLDPGPLRTFVRSSFDQQADAHYNYLWSHCSESEKITLLVVLTLGLQKSSKKTIPDLENISRLHARASQDLVGLGKRGLIEEKVGLYSLFSQSYGRWIRHEILAAPGEEESKTSAEDWIKGAGHKNPKETKDVLPRFKKKYWPIMEKILTDFSIKFAVELAIGFVRGIT
jgi:hypothetical protein